MKIKTSQINIRKIGLIVPVLAYYLIDGVFTMLTTLSARIFSLQSFASSVGQTIPYLSIFTVTCSYLSCHLYTKKKSMGVLWLHFIFHLRWSLLLSEKRQRLWYYTMGQLLFSVFINNRYFTVYTLRLVPKEAETKRTEKTKPSK